MLRGEARHHIITRASWVMAVIHCHRPNIYYRSAVWISFFHFISDDPANMTNARYALFAPVAEPCREISEKAKVVVGYSGSGTLNAAVGKAEGPGRIGVKYFPILV